MSTRIYCDQCGTIHIRRDHRDKLSPYLLEYQPTDPKEDQA